MKRYFDEGTVPDCGFTKENFQTVLRQLEPSKEVQKLTGSGAINLDVFHTHLEGVGTTTYNVSLPNGTEEHEEHWIFWTGPGGAFVVSGSFLIWTQLQFDSWATCALLKWVAGKWQFVTGTARPG